MREASLLYLPFFKEIVRAIISFRNYRLPEKLFPAA
jgi:hypothetical protein